MRGFLKSFFETESAGGILLVAAAALAMLLANSTMGTQWLGWLSGPLLDQPGLTPQHIVNDGLMTLFFLLVGLELKREFGGKPIGRALALPTAAALGGMIVPCLIYLAVASDAPQLWRGWAIPAATDIAFALAVLQLAGRQAPVSLKLFLTTLAVLDDLGAILIIGLFYTARLDLTAFLLALAPLVALVICNRRGVTLLQIYWMLGLSLWLAVLASGLHPTLAGVALALCIPRGKIEAVEHALHPFIGFIVLPLFALANAGVALGIIAVDDLTSALPLGIVLGLLVGKPLGIFGGAMLAVKLKWSSLPFSRRHLLGVACLGGIGFTMSLFIGMLAFEGDQLQNLVRLGVVVGSLLSTAAGYFILRRSQA